MELYGSLAERVAVITGAASGIGAAIAREFAVAGAGVVLVDQRPEALAEETSALQRDGLRVAAIVADVGRVADCMRLVEEAVGQFRRLDIVVNNAAAGTRFVGGTIETIDLDKWELTQNVNLRAPYLISRAAIPHLRAQGGGAIINMTSSAAFKTDAWRPSHAYAASKGGLISLGRAMAVTYGSENIRVNTICPWITRTRLTSDIIDRADRAAKAGKLVPLGRVGEPEDIARAAVFLASDAAAFITGITLFVDGGGWVMSPYLDES